MFVVEQVIYVPPPDVEGRFEVLRIHTRPMKIAADVDLHELAEKTERFTGAELASLCQMAGIRALRRANMKPEFISKQDFDQALQEIKPALTPELLESYAKSQRKPRGVTFAAGRGPSTTANSNDDGPINAKMSSLTLGEA